MTNTPKRFEDWAKVDCNECGRYWTDQCDGTAKDSTKPCNSFLATRNVVIPERLNQLERRVKWLTVTLACIVGVDVCGLIVGLIGVLFRG